MMKITHLIVLWLSIAVIGLVPLAHATPYEDLLALKLELKDLKQDLKDLKKELKSEGKEFKTNNGVKELKLEIKDLKHEMKDLKHELKIEAKNNGWKGEYSSNIQGSNLAQNTSVQAVPEPETLLLLGMGFVALALWHQRMRRIYGEQRA
jgi:hypothetical protein